MNFILAHAEIVAPEAVMLLLLGILAAIPSTRALAHRAIRTGKLCAKDRSLPLWARYGFIVATLPIPGPFDEIVGGCIAIALLKGKHARTVRNHWETAMRAI